MKATRLDKIILTFSDSVVSHEEHIMSLNESIDAVLNGTKDKAKLEQSA